jgi:uncharacterized membrane protein
MALESVVVAFDGDNTASVRFADARDQAGSDAPWSRDVGLVEHHHSGRLLLRGMFGGHYVDVDESDHVSQRGAGEGAVVGGLIGVLAGPAGIALGLLVGGLVGSQTGAPSDVEAEPRELAERLRAAVPRGCSAIVLIAQAGEIDEMLRALGDGTEPKLREPVSDAQAATLEASLGGS